MTPEQMQRNLEFAQSIGRLAVELMKVSGAIANETRAGKISAELIGEAKSVGRAAAIAYEGMLTFAVENAKGDAPLYAPDFKNGN